MASPQAISAIDTVLDDMLLPHSAILDPFCGTGRLLLSPRYLGHNVVGIDCSPLAILASKCAHHAISPEKLSSIVSLVVKCAKFKDYKNYPTDNELFWFNRDSLCKLQTLLYCIDNVNCSTPIRRVLWLILAETSRKVSYAREQEYKLHRMNEEKRNSWNIDTISTFCDAGAVMCKRLMVIKSKKMKGKFRFFQGDFANMYGKSTFTKNTYDAVITSPPYGDSATTVGYGQFARIPLMILNKSVLFAKEFNLSFDYNYDSLCMGGTKCFSTEYDIAEPILANNAVSMAMKRFHKDYFIRLSLLTDIMKIGGIISLVLADRICNGIRYPLIELTSSYLLSNGLKQVFRFDRFLSHKRLPRSMKHSYKNKTETHNGMNYESICCFQKI